MTATMRTTSQTIYASFADNALAEKAAGALLDHGVWADDISLVSKQITGYSTTWDSDPNWTRHPNLDDNNIWRTHDQSGKSMEADMAAKHGISTTTIADAKSGAAKGAGIGLYVGALAALTCLVVPGLGVVIGGGALAMAIAGAAAATAAGAVAGATFGYLRDQGVPEDVIQRYTADYNSGGTILAVTVRPEYVDEMSVEQIIRKYQGNHVGSYGM